VHTSLIEMLSFMTSLEELVVDDVNGRVFNSSSELAEQLQVRKSRLIWILLFNVATALSVVLLFMFSSFNGMQAQHGF